VNIAHISFMPRLINGVEKKTIQMAKASKEVGLNCDFYILNNDKSEIKENLIYKKFELFNIPLSQKKQQQLFTHLLISKNINFENYDFVILRYPGSCSIGSCYFFRKYGSKVITEHQTNEDIEYIQYRNGIINWVKFGLESFCANTYLKRVRAIIGVTNEIVELELKKSGKKPALSLPNGIDTSSIPFTPSLLFGGRVLKLLFISSGASSWHGLDRVIKAIEEYRGEVKLELHIVGSIDTTTSQKPFIFTYGFMDGKELDEVFSSINIGISSLGLDRLGLKSASVLKSREYMARGVPFVYGYDDDDFIDTDLALNLQEFDIIKILEYAKSITLEHQKKMREFAIEHLDWRKKMVKLKNFLDNLA